MRKISLVVAMDDNRLIGRDNALPWRLPDDLKQFKRLTLGKTVLMGRKTWDSLGRPLPERANWILTRDPQFRAEGARVFYSLDAVLAAFAEAAGADGELMVIGGAELYRQTLPLAQTVHLTEVHARVDGGDTWFPALDPGEWERAEVERHEADERHAHAFSFVRLQRRAALA